MFLSDNSIICHQMKCDACKRHADSTSPFLDIFVCDGCYHNLISKVFYPHSIDAWSHKKYQIITASQIIGSIFSADNSKYQDEKIHLVLRIIQNIYYVSVNSKIDWCISGMRYGTNQPLS